MLRYKIIYDLGDNSIVGKLPVNFTNWEEVNKEVSISSTSKRNETKTNALVNN